MNLGENQMWEHEVCEPRRNWTDEEDRRWVRCAWGGALGIALFNVGAVGLVVWCVGFLGLAVKDAGDVASCAEGQARCGFAHHARFWAADQDVEVEHDLVRRVGNAVQNAWFVYTNGTGPTEQQRYYTNNTPHFIGVRQVMGRAAIKATLRGIAKLERCAVRAPSSCAYCGKMSVVDFCRECGADKPMHAADAQGLDESARGRALASGLLLRMADELLIDREAHYVRQELTRASRLIAGDPNMWESRGWGKVPYGWTEVLPVSMEKGAQTIPSPPPEAQGVLWSGDDLGLAAPKPVEVGAANCGETHLSGAVCTEHQHGDIEDGGYHQARLGEDSISWTERAGSLYRWAKEGMEMGYVAWWPGLMTTKGAPSCFARHESGLRCESDQCISNFDPHFAMTPAGRVFWTSETGELRRPNDSPLLWSKNAFDKMPCGALHASGLQCDDTRRTCQMVAISGKAGHGAKDPRNAEGRIFWDEEHGDLVTARLEGVSWINGELDPFLPSCGYGHASGLICRKPKTLCDAAQIGDPHVEELADGRAFAWLSETSNLVRFNTLEEVVWTRGQFAQEARKGHEKQETGNDASQAGSHAGAPGADLRIDEDENRKTGRNADPQAPGRANAGFGDSGLPLVENAKVVDDKAIKEGVLDEEIFGWLEGASSWSDGRGRGRGDLHLRAESAAAKSSDAKSAGPVSRGTDGARPHEEARRQAPPVNQDNRRFWVWPPYADVPAEVLHGGADVRGQAVVAPKTCDEKHDSGLVCQNERGQCTEKGRKTHRAVVPGHRRPVEWYAPGGNLWESRPAHHTDKTIDWTPGQFAENPTVEAQLSSKTCGAKHDSGLVCEWEASECFAANDETGEFMHTAKSPDGQRWWNSGKGGLYGWTDGGHPSVDWTPGQFASESPKKRVRPAERRGDDRLIVDEIFALSKAAKRCGFKHFYAGVSCELSREACEARGESSFHEARHPMRTHRKLGFYQPDGKVFFVRRDGKPSTQTYWTPGQHRRETAQLSSSRTPASLSSDGPGATLATTAPERQTFSEPKNETPEVLQTLPASQKEGPSMSVSETPLNQQQNKMPSGESVPHFPRSVAEPSDLGTSEQNKSGDWRLVGSGGNDAERPRLLTRSVLLNALAVWPELKVEQMELALGLLSGEPGGVAGEARREAAQSLRTQCEGWLKIFARLARRVVPREGWAQAIWIRDHVERAAVQFVAELLTQELRVASEVSCEWLALERASMLIELGKEPGALDPLAGLFEEEIQTTGAGQAAMGRAKTRLKRAENEKAQPQEFATWAQKIQWQALQIQAAYPDLGNKTKNTASLWLAEVHRANPANEFAVGELGWLFAKAWLERFHRRHARPMPWEATETLEWCHEYVERSVVLAVKAIAWAIIEPAEREQAAERALLDLRDAATLLELSEDEQGRASCAGCYVGELAMKDAWKNAARRVEQRLANGGAS